ncbi:hypothetical protein [Nocardioides jiangxiensis]|uniref:DUF4129 domain-containing protein n=1 Tax=Nocardioides jiangxiensis TaxID=3064524 RepID=A0ABT9B2Y5_9ACTN|nr:hypothetical protein [Nocardioides sp. WY-20]MDO7869216.1 hypothetical protein [Nocardioides sp. WY-20]
MRAADDFVGPVAYGGPWTWLPYLLVLAVVGYYAWVLLAGRAAPEPDEEFVSRRNPADAVRGRRLQELDRIDQAVRAGRMPLRTGFQQMSAQVRTFVGEVSDVPARSMTLEELRSSPHPRVAEAIALMYPPEFAPGEASLDDFARSLQQARELVRTWT